MIIVVKENFNMMLSKKGHQIKLEKNFQIILQLKDKMVQLVIVFNIHYQQVHNYLIILVNINY